MVPLHIVRIPSIEYAYIARAIDMGADAVIVPRVETLEQVKTAVLTVYPHLRFWGAW